MSDTLYYQQDTATSTDQIISLFRETFTHSEGAEEGDLIASLVEDLMLRTEASDRWIFSAWEGDLLIGCIFFSKFWFDQSDKSAMMLSPLKRGFLSSRIHQRLSPLSIPQDSQ